MEYEEIVIVKEKTIYEKRNTTTKSSFNIDLLTLVLDKIDVKLNAMAYL